MLLALAGMMFSCQKAEPIEDQVKKPGEGVYGEAMISFSALLPSAPETRAMGDAPDTDIKSMHLVIFDENGMLVETREAVIGNAANQDDHRYEMYFDVTLTVTDQPRIIHFIANCPVDQITYGHEASIIGNLYVTKEEAVETAYWARTEVPYILVDEEENADGTITYRPEPNIIDKFQCVPMLRNYAQVTVVDKSSTDSSSPFVLEGFTLYNTIDVGTVAPYNNKTQSFQSFLDGSGDKYSYPELSSLQYPYEGHALASAELNTALEMDTSTDDGYKWYASGASFYLYERKVSAKTDQEDKWKESPPHVIIKGKYNGVRSYYKVDLVYNVMQQDADGNDTEIVTDIKYYNILRNFRYQFTINTVSGEGYETVEDAVLGATSNNLSGSSTTQKFTNISDKVGRLWVSYTDTTLVSNNAVTLKYKYIPSLGDEKIYNDAVTLENMQGEVISSHIVSETDIEEGEWSGFREVTLTINDPESQTKEQTISVKTSSANLKRDVRYILRQKYNMDIECTPKVAAEIGAPLEADIKLPIGLTDDMFPLALDIEVYDMSLSPNVSMNTLPVKSGISVIPVTEKEGKTTFHYTKTIESKAVYDALPVEGTQKILKTYWYTNKADNASTIWVVNKYFNAANDNFVNGTYAFTDVTCTPSTIACGLGQPVSISFTMDTDDTDYASRTVTVTLEGMTDTDGNSTLTVTPTSRTVTISGLVTTTDRNDVSFNIDADEYAIGLGYGQRQFNEFGGSFSAESLGVTAGEKVNYTFSIPAYTPGMTVRVTLNGLEPSDDEDALVSVAGEEGVYTFKPSSAADYTLSLQTVNAEEGTCSVTMEADEYYYRTETMQIQQVDTKTYTVTRSIAGTLSGTVDYSSSSQFSVTISTGGYETKATGRITRSGGNSSGGPGGGPGGGSNYTYSYTFSISNWTIQYTDPTQIVTVSLTYRNNTYTGTCTVQDLIDGNITGLVLTHE